MKTHTTNYFSTLITVAEDCKAERGTIPPEKDKLTIANYQFNLLEKQPFQYTSDEILFTVFSIRNDISASETATEKRKFFSKSQPCLRTSPLAKNYGWGIYFNEEGKIKLIDFTSYEYQKLLKDENIKKVSAMKNKK
ncbi:DUF6157 family protein [Flavobacterium dauae]|uniref:DUF6157 family protein n=1 Tax=Flavobacterium dauae TaxID=1563479 RepID=UPI00101B4EF2|nr:DUF6157 family protein [Flavobacterium dauae]WLD23022.1 DUF6157 family protein [Flavobacterium dauae]